MPGGRKTDRVRERALIALMSCVTVAEAAAEAGCSERALRGWLKDDAAFQEEYRRARAGAVGDALRQMQVAAEAAVQALVSQARDDDEGTAFRAATALLDRVQKAREAADAEARLAALEQRLGELERRLAAGQEGRDDGHGQRNGTARRPRRTGGSSPAR
jgi:Helix-turn-helix domain